MGFRHWLRQQLGTENGGEDLPPGRSLLDAFWRSDQQRIHALGEYNAQTYPRQLAELLSRRQRVSRQLLELDVADRQARVAAIPRLREMLTTYPHPIAYELLIHAYVDAGRFDEARGVAFAARQRRAECLRSEHPEIRSEIEYLSEWTPEEIEQLQPDAPEESRPPA